MGTSAIVMMVLGMTIIWGGLIASISNVIIKARKQQ
ncbi:methionine/alanine import family NSS transporter small subunit [Priestia endophytica]|jgi:Putative methionine and alanine importer, small subunit|nr:methionine/alanine import family NSS transporter small subunit [Priestia endophytica]MED4071191.1 methionine/alanine import family NSS transporter small subunit [Priestia endophytica]